MSQKNWRRTGAAAVGICGALLASTSPAIAQDNDEIIDLEPIPHDQVVGPFKIDDGSYEGAITQSFSAYLSQQGITLWMYRDGAGEATFDVVEEAMTGEWSLSETGGLTVLEYPGLAEADAVGEASGTLTGSFPYTLAGNFATDVTATASGAAVGGPNITATDSGSDSVDLSFEFAESVQICGQVQANWDESLRNMMAESGWDAHVKTQLVVFPETDNDEIQGRIASLVQDATFAANDITDPESTLGYMVIVMLEAESLMSDIDSYPKTCPLDAQFLRVVNQVLRDMTNTLLDHWEAQEEGVETLLLRRLVEVGLRGGVLGSGAVDTQAAEYLENKITSRLQQNYDQLAEDGLFEDELRQTLVLADMLGYELSSDVSNEDLCLALGGC